MHLVDRHPGFIRNEVHRPGPMKFDQRARLLGGRPDAQGYYEVKTWWRMFSGPNVFEVHEVLTRTDLDVGAR